jgi:alkylhydroperoxidase family enzyme
MANIEQARKTLLRRVLEGDGKASALERRSAFNNTDLTEPLRQLVYKVAVNASAVNDEDIKRARQSGLSEDQIFEIVICAAIGQATRQYDRAKAALEASQRN